MPKCDSCGNDYDKSFQVVMGGQTHVFDSFECAIHTLAPSCGHCGVRIVGHGNSVNLWNSYTEVKVKTAVPIAAASTSVLGAKTAAQPLEINAYPNPVGANLSVTFKLKEASFTTLGIYDMSGKLVTRQISERLQAGSHNRTLEVGNLPVGTYLLKVIHNGQVSTKKLSKQ